MPVAVDGVCMYFIGLPSHLT